MHATGERSWSTALWSRRDAGDTMPALLTLVADGVLALPFTRDPGYDSPKERVERFRRGCASVVMRGWLRSFLAALLAIGFASTALAEKRVALIVANADYKGAALQNPTFDADLVATSLHNIGFAVKVVKNADLGTFDAAVTAFTDDAQGAEVALFYFAGHGFTVNEGIRPVSMLMSTSADVTSDSDRVLRPGGIALDEIVGSLVGKARATLVFVDACRNDPRVSRAVGGQSRGFAPLGPVQGGAVLIGLSTRLGTVARDGVAGMGSPFARAFAANIQTKDVRIDDAFRLLRDAVKSETHGDQLPDIVQDDLPNGSITLVRATDGEALTQPAPVVPQPAPPVPQRAAAVPQPTPSAPQPAPPVPQRAAAVPPPAPLVPQRAIPAPDPCAKASDDDLAAPVRNLFTAMTRLDLSLYADQWAEDAIYRNARTGGVRNKAGVVAQKQQQFARWSAVQVALSGPVVVSRGARDAVLEDQYTLTVVSGGRTRPPDSGRERYAVRCDGGGRWLIVRNEDYLQ